MKERRTQPYPLQFLAHFHLIMTQLNDSQSVDGNMFSLVDSVSICLQIGSFSYKESIFCLSEGNHRYIGL